MSWPLVALGDIFEIARGGSPRPIDAYITDDPDGVNWISIRDASNSSKYITKTEKKILSTGVSKSRLVKPGDFLLTNSMSFGRPYILQTSGCIHDGWLVLRGDQEIIDQDYFYHLLGSDLIYRKFASLAAGAVVKNLNSDLVRSVRVPLPPLLEQRRIAAILDKADALRAKRRDTIAKLDQLLQSVFLEMFGDPVANPKGWEFKKVGNILARKSCNGAYYPSECYVPVGGTPMVHMSDAFYGTVRRDSLKRVAVSQKDVEKYGLSPSDILVSRRSLTYEGSAKPCLIEDIGESLIFESSLIRLTPDPETILPIYLYHFLNNARARSKYVFKHVTKSTISGISQSGLHEVEIMIPTIELQTQFAQTVSKIEAHQRKLGKAGDTADQLFQSLQKQAFAGRL